MLWGQKIEIYTDHKNLVRDTLDFTCDRVHRWRLILEEFDPKVFYLCTRVSKRDSRRCEPSRVRI